MLPKNKNTKLKNKNSSLASFFIAQVNSGKDLKNKQIGLTKASVNYKCVLQSYGWIKFSPDYMKKKRKEKKV